SAKKRTARRLSFVPLLGAAATLLLALVLIFLAQRRPRPSKPVPAISTPSATAYDIAASFVRRTPSGDLPLGSGDRVSPGDRLSLEVRATKPVWVYVLNADERGETYLLYPQA